MSKQVVKVAPYDPEWTVLFDKESAKLMRVLGENCICIHHIGSTAVPGLASKPIIDMIPVVKDIKQIDKNISEMEQLGYKFKGEFGILFRRYFVKSVTDIPTHHVHIYEKGNSEIERYLLFRDWMIKHPSDAAEYGKLKQSLAERYSDDIFNYCLAKEAFITSINEQTGFEGLRLVHMLTEQEQKAAKELLNHSKDSSQKDASIHLICYKNTQIAAYIQIEESKNSHKIGVFSNELDSEEILNIRDLVNKWVNDYMGEKLATCAT